MAGIDLRFLNILPNIEMATTLKLVNKKTSCRPIMNSEMTYKVIGTHKECFLLRYAPENKAIAIMGEKLGKCGTNLEPIPKINKAIITMVLSVYKNSKLCQ